ncbi:putative transcription factor ETV7 isoform 2 [Scophthalmus maximus]|uniref:Putative transcription factor ETV7 isoform 2 n=1 Tax=Scophthalmus maximus TaxID=52904 RepID=A0A2U9BZI5_SCOMX|nr:putative transcription factor ETV7 isoform 2 [Scophthalmus maximus]
MESISPLPLDKQESRANSPSSTLHGGQANSPASVHHSPAHQLQEDLWHLPGRLRINPSLWDKEDVAHWLHWAQKEYSLRRPEKERFVMNGRALCLLTKEDFRRRCPCSGDVLYEILQCVKQPRRAVVCDPQNESPSVGNVSSQGRVSCQIRTHSVQEHRPPEVNDTQVFLTFTSAVSAAPAAIASQPEPMSPVRHRPLIFYTPTSPLARISGRINSCLYVAPKPSSVSCSNRERHPGASQPVQSREAKEPAAQSQRPHPRVQTALGLCVSATV